MSLLLFVMFAIPVTTISPVLAGGLGTTSRASVKLSLTISVRLAIQASAPSLDIVADSDHDETGPASYCLQGLGVSAYGIAVGGHEMSDGLLGR